MSSEGSVTLLIDQLQAGDDTAIRPLWERYFQQLVHLARKRLKDAGRLPVDEEDVALSALDSFFRAAAKQRFPLLSDRDSLCGGCWLC
jgi:hypothetical protein